MSKLINSIDVSEQLLEILGQFDMKLEKIEDYYFVNGEYPGIAVQAFEMERFEESVVVQLDIHIILPKQHFVESFVAHSATIEEAIAETFEQFEVNLLHTLIMAFWGDAKHIENGIGTDIWDINGSRWQIIVSNYGYRGEVPMDDVIEDTNLMYDEIEKAIKALPLEEDIYAFRTVYTDVGDGRKVTEALINNEPFSELEDAVSKLPWRDLGIYYSVRNFVLAMKLVPEE